MSIRGLIKLNEEIKPFSRIYIAEKLKIIFDLKFDSRLRVEKNEIHLSNAPLDEKKIENKQKHKLSGIDQHDLTFYVKEFSSELQKLGFDLDPYLNSKKPDEFRSAQFAFDRFDRLRFFSYHDDNFCLFVNPKLSVLVNKGSDYKNIGYSMGFRFYGSLQKNTGFDFQFSDNHFTGDKLDYERKFSKQTGYGFMNGEDNGFRFYRMNANLNFSWKTVTASIGKDFNYYGSGEDGKLILSDKAPSFPNIKLEVNPVEWLKFSYIYGTLNSQVLDLSTIRYNPERNHITLVDKYFAAHMFSITPFNYLNISFGESVIYSDRFEPVYLIPVIAFHLADLYLTDPDENAGNTQVFGSIWYKNYALQTKFYATLFIDELTIKNLDHPQSIAYNMGFKVIDPIIQNSELVVEYTRINPFIYSHSDSAQTYANYGYEFGHWIGSNADEVFISYRKKIIRGLNFDIWYRYIRKGNEEDITKPRYQANHKFLWGNKNYITMFGASVNYELIHNCNIKAAYEYSKSVGTGNYLINPGSEFRFSTQYGL